MADGALPSDLSAASAVAEDEAWVGRQLAQLEELAEIGMGLARRLPQMPDDTDPALLASLFAKVSRAVRQTLALEARLRRDRCEGLFAAEDRRRARAEVQAKADRAAALAERKLQLRRTAREAIEDHLPLAERGGLRFKLDERIEELADDDEGLFLDRPFSTVLADICGDLRLIVDWTRWRETDWAQAEMRDRPEGSEYAAFHDDMIDQGLWDEHANDLEPPPD